MQLDYRERYVVVTGGTGALGTATVGALLDAGAHVLVPTRQVRGDARFPYAEHPRVRLVPGVDLGDESAVVGLYAQLDALWASIHVAGGFAMAPVADTLLDDFVGMFRLNAVTSFLCTREAVRVMRRSGSGGRIVNVTARPALVPTGGMVAYSTAKAAVASMTQCLAAELAVDGILVNAVVPSLMDTPANRLAMPDADHATWPSVEEVARSIAFLASPANTTTHGGLVPVYGKV